MELSLFCIKRLKFFCDIKLVTARLLFIRCYIRCCIGARCCNSWQILTWFLYIETTQWYTYFLIVHRKHFASGIDALECKWSLAERHTVECRYNAEQHNTILHTSLQELSQNINQRLNPQKTPHSSPWRVSYGVSFVNILEKIDSFITAPHCIFVWVDLTLCTECMSECMDTSVN